MLKSMGPYGIHSQVLSELVSVTAGTLFIIFERSWRRGGGWGEWGLNGVPEARVEEKKQT